MDCYMSICMYFEDIVGTCVPNIKFSRVMNLFKDIVINDIAMLMSRLILASNVFIDMVFSSSYYLFPICYE